MFDILQCLGYVFMYLSVYSVLVLCSYVTKEIFMKKLPEQIQNRRDKTQVSINLTSVSKKLGQSAVVYYYYFVQFFFIYVIKVGLFCSRYLGQVGPGSTQ